MNIFEQASRQKLRFETTRGTLISDDLWAIDLQIVDDIAIHFNKKLSEDGKTSFIKDVSKNNEMNQLKFDIAKHIIDVRLKDIEDANDAVARKAEKQKILEAIASIESAEFGEKTKEELNKMLSKL